MKPDLYKSCSPGFQGQAQIAPEILRIFEADREADQAGGDSQPLEHFRVLAAVAGRARVAERRLDVAQAGGERDMAERSDQVVGLFSPSDIKADHGAEAVCEQAPGQVVVGM